MLKSMILFHKCNHRLANQAFILSFTAIICNSTLHFSWNILFSFCSVLFVILGFDRISLKNENNDIACFDKTTRN